LAIGKTWKKLFSEFGGKTQSLGFCLEPSKLTMVHVRKNFRGMELAHLLEWQIPETGLADLAGKVGPAISELALTGLPVALTINHGPSFIKQIHLPKAAMENLAQVVSYELDRFIPVAPDQVWFNFQTDYKTDTSIHLILFAVHKKPVTECLELLKTAGLQPVSVELAPISCANAFASLGKRLPASWLLLDVAAGVADLYHVNRGKLRHSLHKAYNSRDEIWPDLNEVIQSINDTDSPGGAISLMGEAISPELSRALPRIDDFMIVHATDILGEKFSPELPVTSGVWPALGAALQRVVKVPISVNLLPADERLKITSGNSLLMRTLFVTLIILGLIWAGSIFFREKVALYHINQDIEKLAVAVDQLKQQRAEAQAICRQLQDLWGGKSPVVGKLEILKLLTSAIPDHTWVYSLRLNSKELEISGITKSATDLIQLLDKSGLFSKTQFSSSILNDASGNEKFTIQAKIK
jgi:Tfp pilus assembly protein PilN